jgi:hypothetical protein
MMLYICNRFRRNVFVFRVEFILIHPKKTVNTIFDKICIIHIFITSLLFCLAASRQAGSGQVNYEKIL